MKEIDKVHNVNSGRGHIEMLGTNMHIMLWCDCTIKLIYYVPARIMMMTIDEKFVGMQKKEIYMKIHL